MPARSNVASSLRRRAAPNPMAEFDALPPEVRGWIAEAVLPWSARSVRRLWREAMAQAGGDAAAARARLDQAQARLIARDAARVWGAGHPAANTRL